MRLRYILYPQSGSKRVCLGGAFVDQHESVSKVVVSRTSQSGHGEVGAGITPFTVDIYTSTPARLADRLIMHMDLAI